MTNQTRTEPLDRPPEPDFRLIGYLSAHSEGDTLRMQERAHHRWHQENPCHPCEHPDFPQLAEGMGFWERLRA
jgi:hypothetical protein